MELEGVEPSSKQGNHTLSHDTEACQDYFRFNLRRLFFRFGTTSSERRLVLLPCKRIKLVIYCASIKQREHTHCCQLNFRPKGLGSLQSRLRVLTYHLILLSNPVNPRLSKYDLRRQKYEFIFIWQRNYKFCVRLLQ